MIFRGSRKKRLAALIYFAVLRWTLWREVVRVRLGSSEARSFPTSEAGGLVALRVWEGAINKMQGRVGTEDLLLVRRKRERPAPLLRILQETIEYFSNRISQLKRHQ